MTPQALSALKEQREQLWSTIDAVLEENAKLRAELDRLRSAPVAVEVPTWSADAFCAHVGLEGAFSAGDIRVFFAGAKACHGWISKEAHPIPSDRVLNDGEVAIRADVLSAMEGCIATLRADDELIPSKALAHLDALRSKGGE